jgi:periplasmic copper chaperone A
MTLEISHPWARAATTAERTGGGFFTVANTGDADRLVAASADAAEKVEIHAIKVVGPDIKMRPVEKGIACPAGVTITLKPRGYHLLMTGLKAPLVVGTKVPVTLTFEKAGVRTVDLVVEAPGLVGEAILDESLQPK